MEESLNGCPVPYITSSVADWTIGDVIRKERDARGWNQIKLGQEAGRYVLKRSDKPINKNTVSKVEKQPYSSKLGTVWRLLATLGLTFSEVEQRLSKAPFIEIDTKQVKRRGGI